MRSWDNGPIRAFEVAEVEGLYYPATAEVLEDGLMRVFCEFVKSPRYVRYGWRPYSNGNLVNRENLPASTFRVGIP